MKVGWRGGVVPLGCLLAAEIAMRVGDVHSDALARPSDIFRELLLGFFSGAILRATLQTIGAAFGGVLVGGSLGLVVGLWFGLSPAASRLGAFSVEVFRPIPSVALIPIAMLVYGFGYRMEISVVAFASFWPMLILGQAAVAGIETRLFEVARLLGLKRLQQVYKIILPAALPRIFVAFRLTVGVALVVAVTVEIAANPQGLGYGMILAQQNLRPELMFALLFWVGVIGWGSNGALLAAQRRLFAASTRVA
jgi:ABC-type nitrate/sulfonate/bicarbonate transport system permease component